MESPDKRVSWPMIGLESIASACYQLYRQGMRKAKFATVPQLRSPLERKATPRQRGMEIHLLWRSRLTLSMARKLARFTQVHVKDLQIPRSHWLCYIQDHSQHHPRRKHPGRLIQASRQARLALRIWQRVTNHQRAVLRNRYHEVSLTFVLHRN